MYLVRNTLTPTGSTLQELLALSSLQYRNDLLLAAHDTGKYNLVT